MAFRFAAAAASVSPLLDVIAKYESGGDYNRVHGETTSTNDLTSMSLNQVLDLQDSMIASGAPSSAAGRYQIINKTLRGLKTELGLSGNEPFNASTQDRLAVALLERRGLSDVQAGKTDVPAFMQEISKEWAALPKDTSGRGYYDGDGLNNAAAPPKEVAQVIASLVGDSSEEPVGDSSEEPVGFKFAAPMKRNRRAVMRAGAEEEGRLPFKFAAPSGEPSAVTASQSGGGQFGANVLSRSGRRGVKQSAGLAGQLLKSVGDSTGFGGMIELGDDLIRDAFVEAIANPADISGFEDIQSIGDVGTFLAQTFGEQAFNLGLAVTGAGLGSFLARAAVGKAALQGMAVKSAQNVTLSGAAAGTFGAFLPINTGEILQEARDQGFKPELGPNLVVGALSSALEVVGFGIAGRAIFGGAKQEVINHTIKHVLGRIGVTSLKALSGEGGTELVQEAMVIASRKLNDPTFSITDALTSSEGLSRIAFAGLSGAVVGLGLGGAGGIATSTYNAAQIGIIRKRTGEKVERGRAAVEHASKESGGEKANSLVDFEPAKKYVRGVTGKVTTAMSSFFRTEKNAKANPETVSPADVEAAAANVQAVVEEARQILEEEAKALQKGDTVLKDSHGDFQQAINALRAVLKGMPAVERTEAQDTVVRKTWDNKVKPLLDKAKTATAEEAGQIIDQMFELANKLANTALVEPGAVAAKHISQLINAATNLGNPIFAAKRKAHAAHVKLVKGAQQRVAAVAKRAPAVTERTTKGGTTTSEQEVLDSIDAVKAGTKQVAWAVGARITTLSLAVKKAAAAAGLQPIQQADGVKFVPVNQDESFGDFETPLAEADKVVTTRNAEGRVVSNEGVNRQSTLETTSFEQLSLPGIEVREATDAISESLDQLNTEAEAKTTTVRFYDDEGNFLEEVHVKPDETISTGIQRDLFTQTAGNADAAIQMMRTKYGIDGFAVVNDKGLHTRLKTGKNAYAQFYQALLAQKGRIREGRPLSPAMIIGYVQEKLSKVFRHAKGKKGTITLKMLRDRRQDASTFENNMLNLIQRNNDPDVWAAMAIKHPQLEEETAAFARKVDAATSGALGMEGQLFFAELTEQPHTMWGVKKQENGQPSSMVVEIHKTDKGWRTAKGDEAYVFTAKNKEKLERKLNNPSSTKQFNRYGKKAALDKDPESLLSEEELQNTWEVELVEVEPGFWAIKQTFAGIEDNIIYEQIRKIEERGGKVKEEDNKRVWVETPNGVKKLFHLGEITQLGRLQRMGPGNLLLGTQLTQAHENFMYGMATLINLGYVFPTSKKSGMTLLTIPDTKIIWGGTTLGQSKHNQKSMYALERFFYDYDRNAWPPVQTVKPQFAAIAGLFTDKGAISLPDAVDALLDILLNQLEVEGKSQQKTIPKQRVITRKRFTAHLLPKGTKKRGGMSAREVKKIVYDTGTHTVEQKNNMLVVTDKATNRIVAQLPTTVMDEQVFDQTFVLREAYQAVINDNPKNQKPMDVTVVRKKDVGVQIGEAVDKALLLSELETIDTEELSMLISLSGLHDHSLVISMADATTSIDAATDGSTNFVDPTGSLEAVYNDDGARVDTHSTVMEDDTTGQNENSAVDFETKPRARHDDEASKEAPFKARQDKNVSKGTPVTVKVRGVDTQGVAFASRSTPYSTDTNPFIAAGIQISNRIKGWDVAKAVSSVLKRLNIKERVIIFNEDNFSRLTVQWEKIKNNPNSTAEHKRLASEYLSMLDGLKAKPETGQIFFAPGNVSDRVVLIFISKNKGVSKISRGWRLAHELGHLIHYVHLDTLPKESREKILNDLGPAAENRERFADYMAADLVLHEPSLVQEEAQQEAQQEVEAEPTVKNIPASDRSGVALPAYTVMSKLKNMAQTNGEKILVRVPTIKEFFDYIQGLGTSGASVQKKQVLATLTERGWPLSRIQSLLNSKKRIVTFLVLHEQNHIDAKDSDTYWAQGKDLLTADKIEIEVRASLAALEKVEAALGNEGTIPQASDNSSVAEKLLKGIVADLKVLYDWALNNFKVPLNSKMATFHGFVSALNTYADIQTGKRFDPPWNMTPLGKKFLKEMEVNNAGPYIRNHAVISDNFPDGADVETRSKDPFFQSYVEDYKAFAERVKANPVSGIMTVIRTADSELRSMGLGTIADYFHARPTSTANSQTIFRQIAQEAAPFHFALQRILENVPGSRVSLGEMFFKKGPTAATTGIRAQRARIIEALLLQTPLAEVTAEDRRHVRYVRSYFKRLHKWYTVDMGLKLGELPDYYPMMLDTNKIEYNRAEFLRILKENGFSEDEAQESRMKITRDEDGGLVNGFQEENSTGEFFGPGLASNSHRAKGKWTAALRKDLVDAGFYQEDMATTMIAYTEMLVRRGVWQTNFQETNKTRVKYYERHDVNINSPIARLLMEVEEADLNEWQRARVLGDILPAYAGQLGLRTNSHLRKISGMVVIYQNLRILSMALFSSFVDMGTLVSRGNWSDAGAAFKILMDNTSRAEARIMLREIGGLRMGLAEHVLNDQALNTFMSGKAKRINDLFFRYNGMEGWTNLMRTMALVSARQFIQRNAQNARDGDATAKRYIEEVGLTIDEAYAWDGHSTTNKNINAAINRYIDEAMIRPDPSIRPVWMSDPGYAVFAHLKGFMYGFHETFLRRVGREAKIHQNVLPLIMLGMMALPFAAVGYELRRKITGQKRPEGFAYFRELVERSGLPGAFQMVVDMEQADEYGKPFGLGIAGPSVEQMYDFITKDMDTVLSRAIPVVAQFPQAREWVRNEVLD